MPQDLPDGGEKKKLNVYSTTLSKLEGYVGILIKG